MAVTRVTDIVKPVTFNPYVMREIIAKSQLFQSGIASAVPNLSMPSGGDTLKMPFWNDLDSGSEAIQSNYELTPDKITADTDVARVQIRGKAWQGEDLADELSGSDAMDAVAARVAQFWANEYQDILISSLEGVFADNVANDGGDLVNDIAAVDYDNETTPEDFHLDAEAMLDAAQLLGVYKKKLTNIAMNSYVHTNLQKKDLIQYIPDSKADVGWGTYLGKTVILDDNLPVVTAAEGTQTSGTQYTSYMFAPGAVGWVSGTAKTPTETVRKGLAGEDILVNRQKFILHPRGFKWTEGSVANEMPTKAELKDAANWDRVYPAKLSKVVKIVSNG